MPTDPAAVGADKDADPFALIEKGNAMESCGNLWSAADAFGRASVVLRRQAEEARAQAQGHLNDVAADDVSSSRAEKNKFHFRIKKAVERDRIATLLSDKAREYLYKARAVLLRALEFENDEDQRRAKEAYEQQQKETTINIDPKVLQAQFDPLIQMISEEEGRRRKRIFERVYALPLDADPVEETGAKSKKEQQGTESNEKESIEEIQQDSKKELNKEEEDHANEPPEEDSGIEVTLKIPAAPGSTDELENSAKTEGKSNDDDKGEVALDIPAAPGTTDEATEDAAKTEGKPVGEEKGKLDEKQVSLEERLATFESSIPSELKSEKERMSDIHKGMGRLGLNLPTSPDIARHITRAKPPSEEEQIRFLVEQAKDAARLEGHNVDNISAEAAAAGGIGGGEDEGSLAINDADDLADILKKTHLELSSDGQRPSIAEAFKESFKMKGEAKDLADRAGLLNLISTAQELLFEASAYLEESEDLSEEGEEEEELGMERNSSMEDKCMKQGKASLVEAKKCVDKILRSWPTS